MKTMQQRETEVAQLASARRALQKAEQALRMARLHEAELPSLSHRVQVARALARLARADKEYAQAYVACGGR